MIRLMSLMILALASSTAIAGNGIERIDFKLAPMLDSDAKQQIFNSLNKHCGASIENADSVVLANVTENEIKVDQGLTDVEYGFTFRLFADSLPPRSILVEATHFDVYSSRDEFRVTSVKGITCN